MADVLNKLKKAREEDRTPARDADTIVNKGAPAIRTGESSLTSRPFSMLRLLGAQAGAISVDKAKSELDLANRFNKALEDTNWMTDKKGPSSFMFPVAKSFLGAEAACHPATKELLASAATGVMQTDPDEVNWLIDKMNATSSAINKGHQPRYQKTAMSYLGDLIGGSLVAPPEMGELIPLMRNKSALDRAGARQVPLPPNGKWVAPRQTGPTTGYWVGENTNITESNPTTGEVSMMGKKLAVLTLVPNELFKYASVAADALLREDISKTLSLGVDYAGLYGTGGGGQPKGLINYTGTNEVLFYASSTPVPAGVANNGNVLNPQDGYRMAALIADRNFDSDGSAFKWIMRPAMWGGIAGRRGDAVTAGDQAGVFVQSLTRALADGIKSKWCDHEVVQSSQVINNGTKGSGTGLTDVWGGVWNELLMGLYGAIEFVSNPMGDTAFRQDQTIVRGILIADSVPRYPGAFSVYEDVIMS